MLKMLVLKNNSILFKNRNLFVSELKFYEQAAEYALTAGFMSLKASMMRGEIPQKCEPEEEAICEMLVDLEYGFETNISEVMDENIIETDENDCYIDNFLLYIVYP